MSDEFDFDERIAALEQPELDDEFWSARPSLKHVREAAHSRQRSAPAVLGVVLARVAAMVDHRLRIPPIVGADAGLSLITVTLAPPGVGKSTANLIGGALLPAPEGLDIADQLPLGTGEGMAEVFFGMVDGEPDDKGRTKKVREQVRHNAFFYVDEGQVLGELGSRKNAVLLPTIRTAFTGGTLGQTNASEDKRRILPAGSYTLGVVVALQTVLAGPVLDDADGGTPQRMLWLPATDPTIPEDGPNWPGPLNWQPPGRDALADLRADGWAIGDEAYLGVAEPIRREIRQADLARARGEAVTAVLDAHEGLLKLKLAALLSILDSRVHISEEDWELAAVIKAASDLARDGAVEAVKQDAAMREEVASDRLARRAVRADEAVTQNLFEDARSWLRKKVYASPGRWTVRELRGIAARRRPVFNDALEEEIAAGRIEVRTEVGQGADRKVLWPG